MKKIILVVVIQILSYTLLLSQIEPDSLWLQTYGGNSVETGFSVIETSDDGYVFAGNTRSFGNGCNDVYLVKTDENGNEVWSKTYGGSDLDSAETVIETSDNGFFITGYTYSFNSMRSAIYLIKTDENGDSLWTKVIDETGCQFGRGGIQTSDGNFVVVGYEKCDDLGRMILLKTDEGGNILWSHYICGNGLDVFSSGSCVQETSDSQLIITGCTNSAAQDYGNVYLVKADANGDTLWTRHYDDGSSCSGTFVQQTNDGGFVIVGIVLDGLSHNIVLKKTNESGEHQWTSVFGGQADYQGFCVRQTNDEGFLIAGSKANLLTNSSEAYILKTNSVGDSIWSQSYGSNWSGATNLIVTDENEYVVVGSINGTIFQQQSDAFLLKLGYTTYAEDGINPTPFGLSNYPNPFNPQTSISFSVPSEQQIELSVYNIKGQKVVDLVRDTLPSGTHSVVWEGKDAMGRHVTSGIYFYQLKTPTHTQTEKMILLK